MALYLSHGEDGAELHQVLGAADAINHAIPTHQELSRSLSKFVSYGILLEFEGRFRIYPDLIPSLKKAYEGRGGLFKTGDKGLKWLERNARSQMTEQEVVIDREINHAAHQVYKRRHRANDRGN